MTASTLVSCIGCSGWLFERIHVGYAVLASAEDFAVAVPPSYFSTDCKRRHMRTVYPKGLGQALAMIRFLAQPERRGRDFLFGDTSACR